MKRLVGFFDADCRELLGNGPELGFRPRVEPLVPGLNQLYCLAEEHGLPIVFTTCCSGNMLRQDSRPDVLHVPLDPANKEWAKHAGAYKLFYLEKRTFNNPQQNYACRAFDVFQDNGNAIHLLKLLGISDWVIFGNGFDLCVNSSARGLLRAGHRVHLLEDLVVPSARGYGDCGTPENRRKVVSELVGLGATVGTLSDFLESWR